jgi:iron(III) transport system ATP-binding protein
MPARLDFTDVCHAYERTPVLQGVSFHVEPGMIACLLGASGCGKTTVLRCIAGFEPILSGTVALDGAVMRKACRWLRRSAASAWSSRTMRCFRT